MEEEYQKIIKTAERGDAIAQYVLGTLYYAGDGVKQDYVEAVSWSRKAAEQGDASAQRSLGDCYYTGHGVKQNYVEAVSWYRKAAEQGDAGATAVHWYCSNGNDTEHNQPVDFIAQLILDNSRANDYECPLDNNPYYNEHADMDQQSP